MVFPPVSPPLLKCHCDLEVAAKEKPVNISTVHAAANLPVLRLRVLPTERSGPCTDVQLS